ncbi:hypothetical protein Tsp_07736 [Trichinella spiralis]|uniref:hypothetical protein n=1 Tax=Trichinella spiralis TaxID=6334 RepID=UPI0001EFC9F9|nr:hypothetical protein Tsp_07736 [Trichinella spiralis]
MNGKRDCGSFPIGLNPTRFNKPTDHCPTQPVDRLSFPFCTQVPMVYKANLRHDEQQWQIFPSLFREKVHPPMCSVQNNMMQLSYSIFIFLTTASTTITTTAFSVEQFVKTG